MEYSKLARTFYHSQYATVFGNALVAMFLNYSKCVKVIYLALFQGTIVPLYL